MRFSVSLLLFVTLAGLFYSADGETLSVAKSQLGKALLRRARLITETADAAAEDTEDSDIPEEEKERVESLDAAEDIFVGSGNHVYESQGRSETSGSRREETEENSTEREHDGSSSGDAGEGEEENDEQKDNDDDDEEREESDDDDDEDDHVTASNKQRTEATDSTEDVSGSGLTDDQNAERRTIDTSGSGSGNAVPTGNEQHIDENADQSGAGENTIQEVAPTNTSVDDGSGSPNSDASASGYEEENASKKSEIETASGDNEEEEEEEDSGSAEIIRKGIESLSRLLTPVASGYEFELYSGNAAKEQKKEDNKETEGEGESETGHSSDAPEVHVKKCKQVCKEPMTYDQCAVPRCGYKMGTIKDLCIWLCKHQKPVCSQECE